MGGFNVRYLPRVKRQRISWLWPGYIPRRKMTLLTGDPGLGKSFVAWDFAARVSAGKPWPDGTPALLQGNVILLSAEDDTEDTIAPRLDRLGADEAHIWIIEPEDGFNLQTGLAALKAEIVKRSAVLVVIDPFTAFLGKIDSFKDAEVRGLMGPLKGVIEETNITLLAIMHHNKSERSRAAYRVLGSIGFKAAPRVHYMIGQDPHDEGRHFFMCDKLNIGRKPKALAFRLSNDGPVWESEPVPWAVPDVILSSMVAGEDRTARDRAVEFLLEILDNGEVPTKDVYRIAGMQGIRERTVDRARQHLDVHPRHDGQPGALGKWSLHLPPSPPHYMVLNGCIRCKSWNSKTVSNAANVLAPLDVGTLGTPEGRQGTPKGASTPPSSSNGPLGAYAVNWDAIEEDDDGNN